MMWGIAIVLGLGFLFLLVSVLVAITGGSRVRDHIDELWEEEQRRYDHWKNPE